MLPIKVDNNKPTDGRNNTTPLFVCALPPPRQGGTSRRGSRDIPPQRGDISTSAKLQDEESTDSRSVLVAPVEYQEGVGLSKKVLLVQLVGAQLHGGDVLREQTDRLFVFIQVKVNLIFDEGAGLMRM